jgi:transcriptional adapter 2-alpha
MPYRHEFELEYRNDAELVACDISFSETDDASAFEFKCKSLLAYNSQLDARRFRTDAVEKFSIQYDEINLGKSEDDQELRILDGFTPAERAVDDQLAPVAPYCGLDRLRPLAEVLHQGVGVREQIEDRVIWQASGIKSHREGHLFRALRGMVRDGKVPTSDIPRWNEKLQRYLQSEPVPPRVTSELLNPEEAELCAKLRLDESVFHALKNLLVREWTLRGSLTRQAAGLLSPDFPAEVRAIYDLGTDQGWLM